MDLKTINKEIRRYEEAGWIISGEGGFDDYVSAPTGSCFDIKPLLQNDCAICTQYEDAGEEAICIHEEDLLAEMEDARKLANLAFERIRLNLASKLS